MEVFLFYVILYHKNEWRMENGEWNKIRKD